MVCFPSLELDDLASLANGLGKHRAFLNGAEDLLALSCAAVSPMKAIAFCTSAVIASHFGTAPTRLRR
jgi:hypothetical protein